MPSPWNVVELRQYTLHPGRREDLITLFDTHFIEPQEDVGMRVFGQFRDLDAPNRFVWLRGFPDMASRAESLAAFYERHPAWKEHAAAANATMVDSDDVLLLAPGHPLPDAYSAGLYTLAIHHVAGQDDVTEFFTSTMLPALAAAGAPPLAWFRTEPAENTYPRLPVRAGEDVFVRLAAFSGTEAHRAHLDALARSRRWRDEVLPELAARTTAPSTHLRLEATARSRLA